MTYPFVATEHRLGLLLKDGEDAAAGTVVVAAFTELNGELGAAELSGEVSRGECLVSIIYQRESPQSSRDFLFLIVVP